MTRTIDHDAPLARALTAWADGFALMSLTARTLPDGTTRGRARFEDGGVVSFIVRVPLAQMTAADLDVTAER